MEALHETVLADGRTRLKVLLAEAPTARQASVHLAGFPFVYSCRLTTQLLYAVRWRLVMAAYLQCRIHGVSAS
jgi:hypothetical protein